MLGPNKIYRFLKELKNKKLPLWFRILCCIAVIIFLFWLILSVIEKWHTAFPKKQEVVINNIQIDNVYMADKTVLQDYIITEIAKETKNDRKLSEPISTACIYKESEKMENGLYYTEFVITVGIDKRFEKAEFRLSFPPTSLFCETPNKLTFANDKLMEYQGRTLYPLLIKCTSEKPFDTQENVATFNMSLSYQE